MAASSETAMNRSKWRNVSGVARVIVPPIEVAGEICTVR
jgi:hypothetical protein